MIQTLPLWLKQTVLTAATLGLVAASAHAQRFSDYMTGFDGTDTVNGVNQTTTYNSPNFATTYSYNQNGSIAAGPTAPLAGQNGWVSNDANTNGTGTVSSGNANQINGGTTYVGGISSASTPYFSNTQAGAIGGVYSPGSGQQQNGPYAYPSTASNGVITLTKPITPFTAGANQVSFSVDFALIVPAGAASKDTFSFSLNNTSGASVVQVSFNPSTFNNQLNAQGSNLSGTNANTANAAVGLNAEYRLTLTLQTGNARTYLATFQPLDVTTGQPTQGSTTGGFGGTLAANAETIGQIQVGWNLTDKTTTANGGLTGAGDNYLAFDNLNFVVPEPSTYALLAFASSSLFGVTYLRRKRA